MAADEPLGAGVPEPEDRGGAFPRLGDGQRALLRELGTVREVDAGEVLFEEGDDGYDFFVVESGAVAIVQGYGRENRVVAVHGRHRFLGELNLLTGGRPYLSAVVRDGGEVIQVPAASVRTLVAEDEEMSSIVLGAYLARRTILIEAEAGVKVLGSRYWRTHAACASSCSATVCRIGGWIWRRTRRPSGCCARWIWARWTRRWCWVAAAC